MAENIRVQLVGDKPAIEAIEIAASDAAVTTERRDAPATGQNFGLIEIAALIVVAKSAAELAKMLVGVWKDTKHQSKITVTTPKGSVTLEGPSTRTVDEVLEQLKPIIN